MTSQQIALNDVTGPLVDAYRAVEILLHDNNQPDFSRILSVLNDRLQQVLTSPGIQEAHREC